ncbi:hypothetical protein LG3211_0273 [Lysobacter gummosus]|nr:hypothetical protein LG3211_0273 [Lysobacter gummosus]
MPIRSVVAAALAALNGLLGTFFEKFRGFRDEAEFAERDSCRAGRRAPGPLEPGGISGAASAGGGNSCPAPRQHHGSTK